MIDKNEKIVIGSDHAGYELKEIIKNYMIGEGYEIKDLGTFSLDSMDYPDIAHQLSKAIVKQEYQKGILICGSGNGMNMVANKYKGIRSALCWNSKIAEFARLHNDANILTMPARYINTEEAISIIEVFFNTNFVGGRHLNRINKIDITVKD